MQQALDEILHLAYCMSVRVHRCIGCIGCIRCHDPHWMHRRRFRFPPTIPTRSTATARTWRARRRRPTSGRRGWRRIRRTSNRPGSWRGRATGSGTNGLPEPERKAALEAGIAAGATAIALDAAAARRALLARRPTWARSPNRSACGRASSIAGRSATRCEMTLKLDPAFLEGSADRALGRWYFKVPGLFGGSNKQVGDAPAQVAHLQPATASSRTSSWPRRSPTWAARTKRARKLQAALDAPLDPDWTPEDRRFKEQAKQLLRN